MTFTFDGTSLPNPRITQFGYSPNLHIGIACKDVTVAQYNAILAKTGKSTETILESTAVAIQTMGDDGDLVVSAGTHAGTYPNMVIISDPQVTNNENSSVLDLNIVLAQGNYIIRGRRVLDGGSP